MECRLFIFTIETAYNAGLTAMHDKSAFFVIGLYLHGRFLLWTAKTHDLHKYFIAFIGVVVVIFREQVLEPADTVGDATGRMPVDSKLYFIDIGMQLVVVFFGVF